MINVDEVKVQAKKEYDEECFREEVEKYKDKLRQAKWWHKIMPWKIIIIRRDSNG